MQNNFLFPRASRTPLAAAKLQIGQMLWLQQPDHEYDNSNLPRAKVKSARISAVVIYLGGAVLNSAPELFYSVPKITGTFSVGRGSFISLGGKSYVFVWNCDPFTIYKSKPKPSNIPFCVGVSTLYSISS